jgi:hypothetical protein
MLVVPLGGKAPGETELPWQQSGRMPPVVRVLEASTGRLQHTIDGLSWPRLADFDGDGLEDLWGAVGDRLWAFRAEPPEAWRSLDKPVPAGDLDADGITDVITSGLHSPSSWEKLSTDSRTAVARSGRNGRVLWTTTLDDQRRSLNGDASSGPRAGITSTLTTFPLPGGDLDGDGAPEVVIAQRQEGGRGKVKEDVILPVQVLSGRSGRRLWWAGPLPPLGYEASGYCWVRAIDVRACEGQGLADVLVVHETPWPVESGGPISPGSFQEQARMARLSRRDGRVVWDVLLAEHSGNFVRLMDFQRAFGDLDGDGGLDVVLRTYAASTPGATNFELRALSLRDGKTLWTHPIRDANRDATLAFTVGDLDGDGRAEVAVRDQPLAGTQSAVEIAALDGRDGAARWTWRGGDVGVPYGTIGSLHLADFDGKGRRNVCLDVGKRIVILDEQGHERAGREPAETHGTIAACADLDGDSHDELLVQSGDRLSACRGDLSELWSRPNRERVEEVIPSQSGRPATVILSSMVALDGAKGHTLWKGRPGRTLDQGSSANRPRVLTTEGDAAICTQVLPTNAEGLIEPAQGTRAPPDLARYDPRRARPLPWSREGANLFTPRFVLALGALALINIVAPLLILKHATRRRVASLRMLLALPIVVAFSMAAFQTFVSAAPSAAGASTWQAIAGFGRATLGGLPVVVYVALFGSSLICRRRRRLVKLAILSVLATGVVAGFWLLEDGLRKSAFEHYTVTGRYLVIVPGLYLAGVLAMVALAVRRAWRFVVKQWRSRRAVAMNPS